MYRPDVANMSTVVRLQKRTTSTVNGAPRVAYTDAEPDPLVCVNWKSYGGAEGTRDGVAVFFDTAQVVMWYRPDITQADRLLLFNDPAQVFEITSPPENIEMRYQFLTFRVQRVGGA